MADTIANLAAILVLGPEEDIVIPFLVNGWSGTQEGECYRLYWMHIIY